MIQVGDLKVVYGDHVVLQDVSFDVSPGAIFAILGGSGSGKSTLLRHLIGLENASSGTILVKGQTPSLGARRPEFGVLFQSGALFGSMTIAQNVALPLEKWTNMGASTIEVIVDAKLRLVGLEGFEDHLPSEISGGMKTRAGIARALALDPDLMFFDEPSAGLDPASSAALDDLILVLNRNLGTTIVLVTHELASLFKIATSCILIDNGTHGVIARGDPRELRDKSVDPRVQSFFRRQAVEGGLSH